MILIRFPDAASERKAWGHLAGRFSFKTWATGQTAVPEAALASLVIKAFPSRSKARHAMSRLFRRYEILLPLWFNDAAASTPFLGRVARKYF
jgi:hypothetical protein